MSLRLLVSALGLSWTGWAIVVGVVCKGAQAAVQWRAGAPQPHHEVRSMDVNQGLYTGGVDAEGRPTHLDFARTYAEVVLQ